MRIVYVNDDYVVYLNQNLQSPHCVCLILAWVTDPSLANLACVLLPKCWGEVVFAGVNILINCVRVFAKSSGSSACQLLLSSGPRAVSSMPAKLTLATAQTISNSTDSNDFINYLYATQI